MARNGASQNGSEQERGVALRRHSFSPAQALSVDFRGSSCLTASCSSWPGDSITGAGVPFENFRDSLRVRTPWSSQKNRWIRRSTHPPTAAEVTPTPIAARILPLFFRASPAMSNLTLLRLYCSTIVFRDRRHEKASWVLPQLNELRRRRLLVLFRCGSHWKAQITTTS